MKDWQSGKFDRERISGFAHPFTPAHAVESLHSVQLEELWTRGKRLILLDVDNTLVKWHTEDFSEEILGWLRRAKDLGFDICIISNTNRVERLERIAALVGAGTVRGRPKPSRAMYRLALIKYHRKADEAIMIGDQLITDVFGANRSGIEAIWVRRMDGPEFKGTAINRFMERLLTGPIYQGLVTPVDETADSREVERQKPLAQKTITHQLVKFLMVGAASFALDFTVTYIFMKVIHTGGGLMSDHLGAWLISTFPWLFHYAGSPSEAAAPIATLVASAFGMTNSYLMNRAWTFEVKGKEGRGRQMRRFYAVSIMGQVITLLTFTACFHLTGGQFLFPCKVVAAAVAAAWNFLGSRFYAFKGHV